ncbi:MAG: glutamine amidotransferase [Actinobacteria bacterium HGW-Actinobacteria-2]|nr:MAG: glutamine amidotransferase [Actinobacteria bacterium HGW-Actinobacteria-2]
MATPARATILQLDPEVPIDRFGPWLGANRVLVRAIPVWQRGVPQRSDLGDGVIILGGTMSAHDAADHPWIPPLKELILDLIDAQVPTLGICLGHQLLAEACGGTVTVSDPAGGERGAYPIYWTGAARTDPFAQRLAVNGSSMFPESHSDVVTTLPPKAVLLASSEKYANQAFRVGSAVGVQFHPEASPELMGRWAELHGDSARDARRTMQSLDGELSRNGRLLAQAFSSQLHSRAIAA